MKTGSMNIFGTALTVRLVRGDFPNWQIEDPRVFMGGWVAWAVTDRGEERIIVWLGTDYQVLTREQAGELVQLYQEKGASNVH